MLLTSENILLLGSMLLFVSILAGKGSYKYGLPSLVIFLGIGMLAGSHGPGGIHFDDPKMAQFIGVIALNFILFSGGLETKIPNIRPIIWQGAVLSTFGVLFTALLIGFFVSFVTDFSLLEGMLLGAIVSSTDAAAVFSILRSKKLSLKDNLRPTLELESGSNDPMAYILTINFIILLTNPESDWMSQFLLFIRQMSLGVIMGYVLGRAMVIVINRIRISEGLYPALILSMVLFTYSFTDLLKGNGFLAIYIAAIVLGNSNFIYKKSLKKFFDGQAWLMQIVMFITLGLLVYPKDIIPLIGTGIIISLFLILVARPISVFLCLLPFRVKLKNQLYISWVGLRGAVPIIFATYPMLAGIEKANMIFNLVFFISISSVLIQGTTLAWVAELMGLTLHENHKFKTPDDFELSDDIESELWEVILPTESSCINKPLLELNFPKTALVVLINRENKYITPNGSTVLHPGDRLLIMSEEKENVSQVNKALGLT